MSHILSSIALFLQAIYVRILSHHFQSGIISFSRFFCRFASTCWHSSGLDIWKLWCRVGATQCRSRSWFQGRATLPQTNLQLLSNVLHFKVVKKKVDLPFPAVSQQRKPDSPRLTWVVDTTPLHGDNMVFLWFLKFNFNFVEWSPTGLTYESI